jgi:hypothetical protein
MRLELTRDDLKPERVGINSSQTRFEDFKPDVQRAIAAVGKAMFLDKDGMFHNAIYPPKRSGT